MYNEMKFDGTAWGRGRNGPFYPVEAECLRKANGKVAVYVDSRRKGNQSPIVLEMSAKDAVAYAEMILTTAKGGQK